MAEGVAREFKAESAKTKGQIQADNNVSSRSTPLIRFKRLAYRRASQCGIRQ
jgi:hypothetical protein